jgi:hypothetical protein
VIWGAAVKKFKLVRRSKRGSGRSKPKPNNERDSAAKLVRLDLNAKALTEMIAGRGAILPNLPNAQDNLVVAKLSTSKIGDLSIDQFGRLLCKNEKSPGKEHIVALRLALVRVYFGAANARRYARATKDQIKSARMALASLTNAIEKLDFVRPARQRGLQAVFGSPLDDTKGFDEFNEFGSRCWQIQMNVAPIAQTLNRLIESEVTKSKPAKSGDRKKRLRTLVEALAVWWRSVSKKSWAPYVHAKRLDHRPALVIGRRGPFIELAQTLFCKIDEFAASEVISAVTNVHEAQLPAKAKQKK